MKVINGLKNLTPKDKNKLKQLEISEEDARLQGIHKICGKLRMNVSEYFCKKMCKECYNARHKEEPVKSVSVNN